MSDVTNVIGTESTEDMVELEDEVEEVSAENKPKQKKVQRLKKFYEGHIVTIEDRETGETVSVDLDTLSEEIQIHAALHGIQKKISDGAAGKIGAEAVKAMQAIADALIAGDWKIRKPAEKTVPVSELNQVLDSMNEEEKEKFLIRLKETGIDPAKLGLTV